MSSVYGLGREALKAEDAFNLDKKLDDAAVNGSNFTDAVYDLTQTAEGCVSGFAMN